MLKKNHSVSEIKNAILEVVGIKILNGWKILKKYYYYLKTLNFKKQSKLLLKYI